MVNKTEILLALIEPTVNSVVEIGVCLGIPQNLI